MAANRKRQDEKHLKILRELGSQSQNKQCLDCNQRGPTYVNMTVGSFVCTSCSGILRGLNPPHRVKSISMASFSPEELEFIKSKGNEYCRRVWLGTYVSRTLTETESKDEQRIKDFMIQKYERKRWYVDPSVAVKYQPPTPITTPTSATPPAVSTPSSVTPVSAATQPRPVVLHNTQTINANLPVTPSSQQPPARPSLELFGGFSNDPFSSSSAAGQGVNNANANFANFDNFNSPGLSSPPSVGGGTPMSTNSTGGFGQAATPTAPNNANKLAGTGSTANEDRYAALADLDTLFNSANNANTSVDWNGGAKTSNSSTIPGWAVNGASSASSVYGGTQSSNTTVTSNFSSGPPNPFSTNSQQQAWTPQQQASFTTGNPFASGFAVQSPPGGVAVSGYGPYSGGTPVTSPQNGVYATSGFPNGPTQTVVGGGAQFPMQNGGYPGTWGQNGGAAPAAVHGGWVGFGMPSPLASYPQQQQQQVGASFQGAKVSAQQPLPTTTPTSGPYGSWTPPVGNPFMGGGTPVGLPPRGTSSNPFL